MRTSGQVSSDNAGDNTYLNTTGGHDLGSFTPGINGAEFIGSVAPSNFTGLIAFNRSKTGKGYADSSNGSTLVLDISVPTNDVSSPLLRDDDPQSAGSAGKIYDLDTPGYQVQVGDPVGSIHRARQNLKAWAEYNGVIASDYFMWFNRTSVKKTSSSTTAVENSVSNDNQIGTGTTPTSWDLQ